MTQQRAGFYQAAKELLRGHYAHPYAWDGPVMVITVDGLPIGQGAISTHVTKDGRRQGHHTNAKKLLPWREAIGWKAKAAFKQSAWRPWPIPQKTGVAVDITFTMHKPVSAPKYRQTLPTTTIDLDHEMRAVGDALKKVHVYVDDAQIIDARIRKVFPGEHPRALSAPGAIIAVYVIHPLDSSTGGAESPACGVNKQPER